MQFPALLTRTAKFTNTQIFWSKADLDRDGPEFFTEYRVWLRHMGLSKLRPVDLMQMHARDSYKAEIEKLFATHEKEGLLRAFYARRERRRSRRVTNRPNPT